MRFHTEHEDAARRDFTINALFFDPETETVLDYVGGEDLRAGLIRAVGDAEGRFEEDYLRMLRAVRFAARFGYAIEPATLRAIQAQTHCITQTSQRICDELSEDILTEGHARTGFELMDETGFCGTCCPRYTR